MNTTLIVYCVLIAIVSWVGGWIPASIKLGHRQTQLILSFVSGVMLGVAMLHLLPHSIHLLQDDSQATTIALGGLIFMFLTIRMFPFHDHDPVTTAPDDSHHCDHHDHDHEIRREDISWIGLGIGFSIHTLIDGIALAAATNASGPTSAGLAGLGVFIAIFLHKPLDAMTITSLMAVRGWSRSKRAVVNTVFAVMCPLGAALCVFGLTAVGGDHDMFFGAALAFSAGVFLCISLGDLLPEVQFHSHDRLAMSGALVMGVVIAAVLQMIPV